MKHSINWREGCSASDAQQRAMKELPILGQLLREQGYAAFEYEGGGVLRALADPPAFLGALLEKEFRAGDAVTLEGRMPFLENFLVDAEEFWREPRTGRAESGAWVERTVSGSECALEATAAWIGERRVLFVQNPQQRYDERVAVLQTARDSLLEHERLLKEIQKKEILLHCIVHDLSQPLTAIKGCISLLGMAELPEDFKEVIEIAERQSRTQEEMIRGILDAFASELQAAQTISQDPEKAPDLARAAQKTVEAFASAFAEKSARIELDPALRLDVAWRVVGDEARLLRIFGNLVENALRHSPAGTTVTLRVLDEGGYLRACVDDEGPGLPADQPATKLFALFSKGKGERGGKAGLGLYFCRMTVERWGGAIGCENRVEGGSRFWFRLPRVHVAKPSAAAPPSATESERAAQTPADAALHAAGGTLRILLADDSEMLRRLITFMLEKGGHTVVTVEDGKQAADAAEPAKFDVILLDMEMPVMDGIEAAAAIRSREANHARRVPIIALTGRQAAADREAYSAAGMDACLGKPFSAQQLYAALHSVLGERMAAPVTETEASDSTAEGLMSVLLAKVNGDEKLLLSLLRTYRKEVPRRVATMEKAIAKNDAVALTRAAHSLRGTLAMLGVADAAEIAGGLEAHGRKGELTNANERMGELAKVLQRVEESIQLFAGGK
jgi:signal transduction histidine kinase/DNA-binding response OmpR family regulator